MSALLLALVALVGNLVMPQEYRKQEEGDG